MNISADHLRILGECLQRLQAAFPDALPDSAEPEKLRAVLLAAAGRLGDNYPYPSPHYLGQMLKPPAAVAQLACALAMCVNPNNHAHDGGRASSEMERECIDQLAGMIGWKTHLGHLTSGGTIANLEALWIAREVADRPGVAASSQAHYTHERAARLLRVPFHAVSVDAHGRMDVERLEKLLQQGIVGTVVATLGTTGLGAVDPLSDLLSLRNAHGFRLHVDAAYGGYYRLASTLAPPARAAFAAMNEADSIAIDPHKHGLQPYGCGAILFRDPSVAGVYDHDSPYTYFTSSARHLGEISLECSRSGAAAVALWATLQLWPLVPDGEFAHGLDRCRRAALRLWNWVCSRSEFVPVTVPELDVVVWAVRGGTASESSRSARRFFDAAATRGVHLALLKLPRDFLEPLGAVAEWDADEATCLRACLIKPEHFAALPEILDLLEPVIAVVRN